MIAWNCRRFGGADALLVEAKANGLDVIKEMQRLYGREKWGVVPINPKTDKVARALSVQPSFAHRIIYAPDRDFARMLQDEMALFPNSGQESDMNFSRISSFSRSNPRSRVRSPGMVQVDRVVRKPVPDHAGDGHYSAHQ
jgi:hypothetical protein